MKLKLTELTEKITPLPLTRFGDNLEQFITGLLPNGSNTDPLATCYSRTDAEPLAAYLVHCANTLPKLVEALEKALNRIDHLHDVERAEWKDDDADVFNEAAAILTLAREVEI